jgi:hypothetical protein
VELTFRIVFAKPKTESLRISAIRKPQNVIANGKNNRTVTENLVEMTIKEAILKALKK